MRTTIGEVLPALRRPAAVAALTAAVAGGAAALLPVVVVWRTDLRVEALGTVATRRAVDVTGADWSAAAWLAVPAGLLLLVVAVRLALDLPLARTTGLALASAAVLAGLGLAVLVLPPDDATLPERLPEQDVAMPVGLEADAVRGTTAPARALLPLALAAGGTVLLVERRG